MTSPRIGLVVFDMAGTIVDHGSLAPIAALVTAFAKLGINVTVDEARGPMGLHKLDHIAALLRLSSISSQWTTHFGTTPDRADAVKIYEQFLPVQAAEAQSRTTLIPGALSCLAALKERRIAVGTTTGYPRQIGQQVADSARDQGFVADCNLFPDDVSAGRPAPWMIFRIMETTKTYPAASVVKVGDTIPDIEEGRNAGTWVIGITETGNEIGLTHEEWQAVPKLERATRAAAAGEKLLKAGAHAVIRSVAELPQILGDLEAKLQRGERP